MDAASFYLDEFSKHLKTLHCGLNTKYKMVRTSKRAPSSGKNTEITSERYLLLLVSVVLWTASIRVG